jgi:hypothetical protein
VVLADGVHVVLRALDPAARGGLAQLLAQVPEEERLAFEATSRKRVVMAWDGERVAGAALLAPQDGVGVVRVVLDPAYRRRRLGTWMLLDLVHLGTALGLFRLEARAGVDDADLLAALRRLDFVEEAPRSSPASRVLVKTLHAGWPDF